MNKLIAFLICSITPLTVQAESNFQSKHNEAFQVLCIGEPANGFNWEDGAWVHTRFKPSRLMIRKVKIPDTFDLERPDEMPISCMGPTLREKLQSVTDLNTSIPNGPFVYDFGCYIATDFDDEPLSYNAQICDEMWNHDGTLVSVRCSEVAFEPNGNFHDVFWHTQLEQSPPDDYKDSMLITVGKCSVLQ